jgi:hypothetical protein
MTSRSNIMDFFHFGTSAFDLSSGVMGLVLALSLGNLVFPAFSIL